jgi:hypothetical protein
VASTMAPNDRILWTYTDDNSTDYGVAAKAVYVGGADAAKYGGEECVTELPSIPNGLRPRCVKCKGTNGSTRWMIAYDLTATIWTTPGTTLTLNSNGVDVVFTAQRTKRGERLERMGKDPVPA